jgi:hypothetical protein
MGFDRRASHLQIRCYTAWATPLVYFAVVILDKEGGLKNYLPGLDLNLDPLDFSLLSSQDYRHELSAPGKIFILFKHSIYCYKLLSLYYLC